LGLQIPNNNQGVLAIKSDVLLKMGANNPDRVLNGQVYRLLTAAFLHANLAHLLSNCVSAYILISRL
jgi:membrane associated rhomboid family serine protease